MTARVVPWLVFVALGVGLGLGTGAAAIGLGSCKDDGGKARSAAKVEAKKRIAAFLECVDKARRMARPDELSILVRRCVSEGRLFGRQGCNQVWRAAEAGAPDEQPRLIAAGCGQLYCRHLKAPKPGLCGRLEKLARAEGSVRAGPWRRLFEAVLRSEAGDAVTDARIERVVRALSTVLAIRVDLRPPPGRVRATEPGGGARAAGSGARVRAADPGGATGTAEPDGRPLAAGPEGGLRVTDPAFIIRMDAGGKLRTGGAAVEREALLSRMKGAPESKRKRGVLIHVHPSAPKGQVIRLFELLKQAGITRFAVSMEKRGGKDEDK